MKKTFLLAALGASIFVNPAFAHVGHGEVNTFTAGVMHPLTGLDHLLAAFAVGLWATLSGAKRPLVLPAVFVTVMALAVVVGAEGWQVPYIEPAIAGTVVALGLLIVFLVKAPTLIGVVLMALFAFVHGHAHGAEGGAAAPYLIGLVAATGLLHLAGVGSGQIALKFNRPLLARLAGGAIAATGVWFLVA